MAYYKYIIIKNNKNRKLKKLKGIFLDSIPCLKSHRPPLLCNYVFFFSFEIIPTSSPQMETFQPTNSEISYDVEDGFLVPMAVDEDDLPELQLINDSNERMPHLSLDLPSNRHSFKEMNNCFKQAISTASEFTFPYICGTIVDGGEESVTDVEKWQPLKEHFEE